MPWMQAWPQMLSYRAWTLAVTWVSAILTLTPDGLLLWTPLSLMAAMPWWMLRVCRIAAPWVLTDAAWI
jgi:hypothetical protein